jgi:hypothetical protein
MKSLLLAVCILFILGIAAVYVFIPSHLAVVSIVPMKCNVNSAGRVLNDTAAWSRWWPSGQARYRVARRLRRGAEVVIDDGDGRAADEGSGDDHDSSLLSVFPLVRDDSSYLQWQLNLDGGAGPIGRIGRYREARKLKDEMGIILDSLRSYLEVESHIYGMDISEGTTKDSFLVMTGGKAEMFPNTATIYGEVGKLKTYLADHNGRVTGYPMVNVSPSEGGGYELRVALPTDKLFPEVGGKVYGRRLIKGKYLEADVRGGDTSVLLALQRMKEYIEDHGRTVMAIPFQSLVTDRSKEGDTSRWVTRLYYPIY